MSVARIAELISNLRQAVKDWGTCLLFDGVNDILTVGTGNPFSGSFYIHQWIKWNGVNGGFQTLFAKRDSYAPGQLMFSASINPSGQFNIDTITSFINFGYTFLIRKWIPVCWVHDVANNLELLYVGGFLVASRTLGTLNTKTDALISFGATQSTPVDTFWGEMDEPVIGIGAPTADQVLQMARGSVYPNPYTILPLDEGSGTTANDISGNGNNGTISGATYITDKISGVRPLITNTDILNDPRTNVCVNPHPTSVSNFTPDPSTPIYVSSPGFDGATGYMKVVGTSNLYDRIRFIPTWKDEYRGKRVVFSIYLKADTGNTAAINIEVNGSDVATKMITGLDSTWQRHYVSYVLPKNATSWRFMIYPKNYPDAAVQNVLAGGILVELVHPVSTNYPTNYFDGSSPNCSWAGTANASESTRNTTPARPTVSRSSL